MMLLDPEEPVSALAIATSPLLPDSLPPLKRCTTPPIEDELSPARSITEPPTPLLPPTATFTEPVPAGEAPVNIDSAPLANFAWSDCNISEPLESSASALTMETLPLLSAKLPPLVRVT
jgi:hypothetical protein